MSFWSSEKLKHHAITETIIEPYDPKYVKHGAYELAVGPEAFITSADVKEALGERGQIKIPSGQFGLLITEEIVSIPRTSIAFISIRATVKFLGLVNVSGFHVDPGFSGRLKFSVYNAGSQDIVLERGERIFMIWLSDLDQPTADPYKGIREGQMGITAADVRSLQGDIASPAALKEDIKDIRTEIAKIEKELVIFRTIAASLAVGLLLAFLVPYLREREPAHESSASQPTPTAQLQPSPPAAATPSQLPPSLQDRPAPTSTPTDPSVEPPPQKP